MNEISTIRFHCASANVKCSPKTCKVCKVTKTTTKLIKFVLKQLFRMCKVLMFIVFMCVFLPVSFALYVLKSIFDFLYKGAEKMAGKPLRGFVAWANK